MRRHTFVASLVFVSIAHAATPTSVAEALFRLGAHLKPCPASLGAGPGMLCAADRGARGDVLAAWTRLAPAEPRVGWADAPHPLARSPRAPNVLGVTRAYGGGDPFTFTALPTPTASGALQNRLLLVVRPARSADTAEVAAPRSAAR